MLLGDVIVGGEFVGGDYPIDGLVRSMRISAIPLGGAFYTFDFDGTVDDQEHLLLVLLDGELIDILPDTAEDGSFLVGDSAEHSLTIRPHRGLARPIPDLHGDFLGGRAYLKWSPSSDSDVVSYIIRWDSGDASPMSDLATVSVIEIEARYQVPPDTGTGSGLITIGGSWAGDSINTAATLEVGAAGRIDYIIGADSGSVDFAGGERLVLPNGVEVEIIDEAADYDIGDTWEFQIGPATHFLSDSLADGTYSFTVLAADAAGNESSEITAQSIKIALPPSPVTSSSIAYDAATDKLSLAWTDPADGDLQDILIYSNFSATFGDIQEHVIDAAPLAVISPGVETYEISSPIDGDWRFWIRTRDTSGRINPSAQDLALSLPSPSTSLALADPVIIAVDPAPGGTFDVTFLVDLGTGVDIDGFAVYANTDPNSPVFSTPEDTLALTEASGYPIATGTWRSDVYVAPTYFTVRATSGSEETTNTDLTLGTPDAAAPTLPDELEGTPS